MATLSVLIVDDHPMMRQGIRGVLETNEDFQVVGEAADGDEAMKLIEEHSPDLVLMDVEMPNVDGLEATRHIKARWPDTKVVGLTIHDEPEFVKGLLRAGAVGYVLKRSRGPALVNAIRLASQGGMALDSMVGERIIRELSPVVQEIEAEGGNVVLSERQVQILQWLADGLTTRQIATNTKLSERTVKGYVARILRDLGVHTRAGAVGVGLRQGIINKKD